MIIKYKIEASCFDHCKLDYGEDSLIITRSLSGTVVPSQVDPNESTVWVDGQTANWRDGYTDNRSCEDVVLMRYVYNNTAAVRSPQMYDRRYWKITGIMTYPVYFGVFVRDQSVPVARLYSNYYGKIVDAVSLLQYDLFDLIAGFSNVTKVGDRLLSVNFNNCPALISRGDEQTTIGNRIQYQQTLVYIVGIPENLWPTREEPLPVAVSGGSVPIDTPTPIVKPRRTTHQPRDSQGRFTKSAAAAGWTVGRDGVNVTLVAPAEFIAMASDTLTATSAVGGTTPVNSSSDSNPNI